MKSARFRLIACEILTHEIQTILDSLPESPKMDVEFLPKGLHDVAAQERRAALADSICRADESGRYDAILLGYGLCSRGIVGLSTRKTPLVVPRVHDCIALLFGGCQPYEDYFFAHPGTYFQTVGWLELGDDLSLLPPDSIQAQCGAGDSLEAFCEKYGPENGPYLWRELGRMTRNYSRLAFLKTNRQTDEKCEKLAQNRASQEGWTFDVRQGNLTLLTELLSGKWNGSRFLVLPPGRILRESFNADLICD